MAHLADKKCVPCMGGVPPMPKKEAHKLLAETIGWELIEDARKIKKTCRFNDFREAMSFVNQVADLCEEQGHHADMHISYRVVTLEIFTHKINGLTESDFILAAKIDRLK
ncbi:MAG: 4a-hydroxytetrahydrobiopterin dehydratase [Candidatus Diapherotrites archaeon]|nr:4a-hydroxytetrahydrobiopterin dehydratase [Candidatus Diapherotrites archaeon]